MPTGISGLYKNTKGAREAECGELKPCPFCGGKAEIRRCKLYLDEAIQVHCTQCGTSQPKEIPNHRMYSYGKEIFLTEKMATEKIMSHWNRRTTDEQAD